MHVSIVSTVLAAASLAAHAEESGHHWTYSGPNGPSHWGGTCSAGKSQSPVDIRRAAVKPKKLPALAFAYRPVPLHMIDNGHSIQVDVPKGSTLTVGEARFALIQFHFHKPSEEEIDGRHFPMVAHLVHRDDKGNLAVVVIPLEAGSASPLIHTLWAHLPRQTGRPSSPTGVTIDPAQLLPAKRGYYTYVGSLTTPPCTEGVRWLVLKSPVTISGNQVAMFAKLYPANARPVQPLHGREVLASK